MPFARLFEAWRKSSEFQRQWVAFLRSVPFNAYCWENPPLTVATTSGDNEFVFVESPGLSMVAANIEPFSKELSGKQGSVSFKNLRGDALLVAPCPMDEYADYAHLAAFMRTASEDQAALFWQKIGNALGEHLSAKFTWLSTAGLGVSWVHVRLDSRPKYYRHHPYTNSAFWDI